MRVIRDGYWKGKKPPNAGRKFPAELFTPDEMERLLSAALTCHNMRGVPERNHAMLIVLWRCGLRCGEALALMPRHVNLADGTIQVPKSKTPSGLRTVGVEMTARESLERWLTIRTKLGIGDDSPVFCTLQQGSVVGNRGKPLRASQWRETIKKLAKRAGITKRVSSHSLRHQFASETIRENVPLPVLSQMLGHKNTLITHRYISHTLASSEAIDAMRTRSLHSESQPGTVPVPQEELVRLLAEQNRMISELLVPLSTGVNKPTKESQCPRVPEVRMRRR
jgi:site-specific recombinase XerD